MDEQRKLSLTAAERETIVLFNDSSNECIVYTCSRPVMTKLDKLCKSNPKTWRLKEKDKESKTYLTEKNLISFRADKVKMELTDEQRKKMSDRAKKTIAMQT
ncbi:MAG: hypothetical protein CVU86_06395 [Firmicutes bacterium HGW-Firmicutes-11]|jgi:hypothetical protein|nr:MAG: hypothetical protein CVU86_06395 [Firmicutes bacterium HGW-Firmicutes-11]